MKDSPAFLHRPQCRPRGKQRLHPLERARAGPDRRRPGSPSRCRSTACRSISTRACTSASWNWTSARIRIRPGRSSWPSAATAGTGHASPIAALSSKSRLSGHGTKATADLGPRGRPAGATNRTDLYVPPPACSSTETRSACITATPAAATFSAASAWPPGAATDSSLCMRGPDGGELLTRAFIPTGPELHLNIDVTKGEATVRVCDFQGTAAHRLEDRSTLLADSRRSDRYRRPLDEERPRPAGRQGDDAPDPHAQCGPLLLLDDLTGSGGRAGPAFFLRVRRGLPGGTPAASSFTTLRSTDVTTHWQGSGSKVR